MKRLSCSAVCLLLALGLGTAVRADVSPDAAKGNVTAVPTLLAAVPAASTPGASVTTHPARGKRISSADAAELTAALESMTAEYGAGQLGKPVAFLAKEQYDRSTWQDFFDHYLRHGRWTPQLSANIRYALWSWGDQRGRREVQYGLARALMARISELLKQHEKTLCADMREDPQTRNVLYYGLVLLDEYPDHDLVLPDSHNDHILAGRDLLGELRDFYVGIARTYPALFSMARTIDVKRKPGLGSLRTQFHEGLLNLYRCGILPEDGLKRALGMYGKHVEVWDRAGMLVLDNNGFNAIQMRTIRDFVVSLPPTLLHTDLLTCRDLLEAPEIEWSGTRNASNIGGWPVRSASWNPFPDDIKPSKSDSFCEVLAHEMGHSIMRNGERELALIAAAGPEPMHYLRSMVEPGGFVSAPQEFFASICGQWFTDSAHTLALGMQRFASGNKQPLAQALFVIDVFSSGFNPPPQHPSFSRPEFGFRDIVTQGSSTSRFWRIGPSGAITYRDVRLSRDKAGRITAIVDGRTRYSFRWHENGEILKAQAR